jgi:GT2 family glycosyltransferase
MFVPRDVWIKVGPFDEGFPEAACEDWEWSTRATLQGVRIVYCPDAAVKHPVHCTWRELRRKARRLVRGELLLARKRRRHKVLDVEFQFAAYSKRLRSELALIISNESIRWSLKPSVATAACAVWFWSILEARKQLTAPLSPKNVRRKSQAQRPEPNPKKAAL